MNLLFQSESLTDGNNKEVFRVSNFRKKLINSASSNLSGSTIWANTGIIQDPFSAQGDCTDWYLVTYYNGTPISEEFVATTCTSNGDGGGGAADLSFIDPSGIYSDNGKLSCRSFNFKANGSNAYEAGVKGLNFSIIVAGSGTVFNFQFRNIFINFPKSIGGGMNFTPSDASSLTAKAFNRAALSMAIKYQSYSLHNVSMLTTASLEVEFKSIASIILTQEINASAEVYFIQAGQNTVITNAVFNTAWDIIWNGLTGTGCSSN